MTASSISENEWLDSLGIPIEWRQVKIKVGKKLYIVDAFDQEKNTIYEFHGDYWHGNPKSFHPYKINKQAKKTFKKLHAETLEKENALRKAGYIIISIWESDWKKGKLA